MSTIPIEFDMANLINFIRPSDVFLLMSNIFKLEETICINIQKLEGCQRCGTVCSGVYGYEVSYSGYGTRYQVPKVVGTSI